jgi:hypothetical protein
MLAKKCSGFLSDGVTKCPYGTKQGDYCNIHFKKYNMECEIKLGDEGYENLLIVKFPDVSSEWDFEKNVGINLKTMNYSSHTEVWWLCSKSKHSYKSSPNARTGKKMKNGCKECAIDSLRVHDKELKEEQRNKKVERNTTSIGDETEKYISNLLINSQKFKNVEIVGNIGGSGDIYIKDLNDNVNYIQIKTLTYNKGDIYYMTNDHKYEDNMLIVMTNKQRNRFALEFAGKIKVKRLTLVFDYENSKYKNIMYTNVEEFLLKLIEQIPLSTSNNKINSAIDKELMMLKRFEKFCNENNIIYNRNNTNGNYIDGFINGFSFQSKFVSLNRNGGITCCVSFSKSAGRLNGKNIKKNYDKGDIDFVVVELGGTIDEPEKYLGNFCIIPEKILLEQNILVTEISKGKKNFYICPPFDYDKHWSKEFWNNISNIPNPSV